MTLNVNLEDVPWAILEAVRGRIMSNRRRLEESQQEQQRPALQPKPQFRKFGADGRTWKRPEPAAVLDSTKQTVIGAINHIKDSTTTLNTYADFQYSYLSSLSGVNVPVTFAALGGQSGYTKTTAARTELFSASGKSSVTIDLPLVSYPSVTGYTARFEFIDSGVAPGFGGDWKYYRFKMIIENVTSAAEDTRLGFLCLPIQADKFIVILLYSHYASVSISDIYPFPNVLFQQYFGESLDDWPGQALITVQNWYLSGDSEIRFTQELTTRDYSQVFPNLTPSFIGSSFTQTQNTLYSTDKFYKAFVFSNDAIREITVKGPLLDLVSSPDYFGEPATPLPDAKALQANIGKAITPYVYAQLNQRINFVAQEQIKQFPSNKKPILADVRAGFFNRTAAGTPGYGQEPLWAEYAGNLSNVPPPDHNDENLYLKYRNLKKAGVAFPGKIANQPSFNFNWVWDWDDPAYCRRMCLALGFTAADLTP
jgi:hypothetical protein